MKKRTVPLIMSIGHSIAGLTQVPEPNQGAVEDPPVDLGTEIDEYKGAIDSLVNSDKAEGGPVVSEEAMYALLLKRDRIAAHLKEVYDVAYDIVASLRVADQALKDKGEKIVDKLPTFFSDMRATDAPKSEAWWWSLDVQPAPDAQLRSGLWLLFAVFLLTISLAAATDAINRFLTAPDKFGTFSIVVQAALAFVAGGTFVSAARPWVTAVYKRTRVRTSRQPFVSAVLAAILFAAVFSFRAYLPTLSLHYYSQGMDALNSAQDPALRSKIALDKFKLSAALDPHNPHPHFELGVVYQFWQKDYASAATEYQTSIELNPASPGGYNQLAVIIMLKDKDYGRALALLGTAGALAEQDDDTLYAIYKNEAWAMWGLKDYKLAGDSIDRAIKLVPKSAEAYAVKAQIIQDWQNPSAATPYWKKAAQLWSSDRSRGVTPYWLELILEKQK